MLPSRFIRKTKKPQDLVLRCWRLSLGSGSILTVAACAGGPTSPLSDDGATDQQALTFCETEPLRSDSLVTFSEPQPIDGENVEYEISISADFEHFEGEFRYPDTLICNLVRVDGEQTTDCPNYQPTEEEFIYDNIPNWTDNDAGELNGFRWFRIVDSTDVRLTRDGEVIFDGTVEFDVSTSDCPEHEDLYNHLPDHPEYEETYRYAEATIDT